MSKKTYCINCFGVIIKGVEYCPKCKYPQPAEVNSRYLQPPFRLHHQYVIGRVLGEGGFGITYLAYDRSLGVKVVVKEYFPLEFSTRHPQSRDIVPMDGDKQQYFVSGKRKFISEARLLSSFRSPYIVRIRHFFEENNTAYFVMEYIEGKTFEQYIKDHGGKISFEHLRPILMGILDGLDEVHSNRSYHRDIKPENIYMSHKDQPLLLDFGSARQETAGTKKTTMSLLTPGFAPIEQYSTSGIQGPWTDIYGLASTMYYALTGDIPPLPSDRLMGEAELPNLLDLGAEIRPQDQEWLYKGLELHWNKRPASIEEWRTQLPPPPTATKEDKATVTADDNFIRFAILPKLTSRILTPEAEREIYEAAGFLDISKEHTTELIERSLQMTGSERRDLKKELEAAAAKRQELEARFKGKPKKKPPPQNISNLTFSEIFQPEPLIDEKGPLPETLTNSLGMDFVLITPYTKGAGFNVPKPFPMQSERDRHAIALTEQYYIQKHPITQAQWHKLMGDNPSKFTDLEDTHPVEQVSWNDCQEFIERLNRLKEGIYRFPTEAEWMYACRADSKGPYYFGANPKQLVNHAWYNKNANGETHPVGTLEPNPFGLYDVYGNVWEWVGDFYAEWPETHLTNPKGPESGNERVIRGGSWMSGEDNCTNYKRWKQPPTTRSFQIGCRLVLEIPADRQG